MPNLLLVLLTADVFVLNDLSHQPGTGWIRCDLPSSSAQSGIPEKLVMDSTCLWGSFMCWSTMHGETESLPCSLVSGLQRGNSA